MSLLSKPFEMSNYNIYFKFGMLVGWTMVFKLHNNYYRGVNAFLNVCFIVIFKVQFLYEWLKVSKYTLIIIFYAEEDNLCKSQSLHENP